MKNRIILVFLILTALSIRTIAVEGMWLPSMIWKNIDDMRAMGFELTAGDLYSEEGASIKDAIVRFGRGCTGSFISQDGLLITNHHCGLSQLQNHSTVENDFLTHGFWAANRAEELKNDGLTVTILVRMADVTSRVLEKVTPEMNEQQRREVITTVSRGIEREASEGGKYETRVEPFYSGNQYWLFVSIVYRDVRLVGAPPSSVGKFGGDTDNWVWPRHTGDFMLFRVYAGADNQPADFSPDNKPYKPARFLQVSAGPIKEHDFTMVYGFPGRTSRYLTSDAVDFILNREYPLGIAMRTGILDIYRQGMAKSARTRIQYTTKQASLANTWKRWQGEVRGLNRLDAINVKKQQEAEMARWIARNPDTAGHLAGMFEAFESSYRQFHPLRYASRLYFEGPRNAEIVRFALNFEKLVSMVSDRGTPASDLQSEIDRLKPIATRFFRDYEPEIDRHVVEFVTERYLALSEPAFIPGMLMAELKKHRNDPSRLVANMFRKSVLVSGRKTMDMLQNARLADLRKLARDPAFIYATAFNSFHEKMVQTPMASIQARIDSLYRVYINALKKKDTDYNYFPDANSTLRITYGRVEGSMPNDGIIYKYYTTTSGILEKSIGSTNQDYEITDRLMGLLKNNDFGPFGHDGRLKVNFIASNHTTGGNSGSPVLNARGQFMGINFDRSWESTMSDIMFDPEQCRNISVTSEYILWIISHYAGAHHLLQEMEIVK